MKDIFDHLENAMDDEINEIADKTPELSDAQINKLLKMSERKYNKRKNSENASEDYETKVQGVDRYKRPMLYKYFAAVAACFVAVIGLSLITMLIKRAPADNGPINIPPEMFFTGSTSTSTEIGDISTATTDAVYSDTTGTKTTVTGVDKTTSQNTTVATTSTESPETSSVQEAETPVTEPQSDDKTTATENGLPENVAGVYSSKSGIITLNDDGTGTISFQDTVPIRWNSSELISDGSIYPYTISGDTITVNVDGMELSFTKGGEAPHNEVQNPIMNFVGNYQSGRAIMFVEALGDNSASITISWAGSAVVQGVWTMSGECVVNGDIINVSYNDSTCRMVEYDIDGNVVTDKTEYTNGTGTLTFSGNTVKWNDNSENVGDVMLFEYIY